MNARWEIIRTSAGWHARFRAANSRIVMSTEVYTRKRGAENAIESVTGCFIRPSAGGGRYISGPGPGGYVEVRYIGDRP